MKFLIWQTAFLGDVVLSTPLIRTVKENFPNASILFVGRPFIKDLLKGYKITLLPFSKGLIESFSIVNRIKICNIAIVPHRSLRTALIIGFSGIERRIGFDRSELPVVFTDKIPHKWELHEVERNLQLLSPLNVEKYLKDPLLFLEEEETERVLRKFNLRSGTYVVANPFSNFPLKEWYIEGWNQLIKAIGKSYEIVITGLPSDKFKAEKLKGNFKNLVGKTSLRELMGIIKGARLVISNDSSPVHIANALGVPAITVYTATSPEYGFYPLIGDFVRNPADCSPCSPNPKKCLRGTLECLRSVTPELVLKSVEKFL